MMKITVNTTGAAGPGEGAGCWHWWRVLTFSAVTMVMFALVGVMSALPAQAAKKLGTVVAWGDNSAGQTTVPAGLTGVTAIAAGGERFGGTTNAHSLALKSDGSVVAWGDNFYGQTTVPAGLTGVTAIAGGAYHSLALKSNGTVVAWGDNSAGQTTVPAELKNVAAIAAGDDHSLALASSP